MFRRVVLVVSAIGAVLLGMEKVGVFQFVPPGEIGFRSTSDRLPDGRSALLLHSDAGDLSCWLRLIVAWHGPDTGVFQASMDSGEPLVVTATRIAQAEWALSISKGPHPSQLDPFLWRAGLPIRVSVGEAVSGSLVLNDWVVHAAAQPSDSRIKARWRRMWTWFSWALLLIAVVGAAVAAWPPSEPKVATSLTLVRAIVSSIDGDDDRHTAQLRTFLRKVLLETVPVNEAFDALKVPITPFRVRPQFLARARRVFLDRVVAVKKELDAFGERLK